MSDKDFFQQYKNRMEVKRLLRERRQAKVDRRRAARQIASEKKHGVPVMRPPNKKREFYLVHPAQPGDPPPEKMDSLRVRHPILFAKAV